jgi:hypothetical protein
LDMSLKLKIAIQRNKRRSWALFWTRQHRGKNSTVGNPKF